MEGGDFALGLTGFLFSILWWVTPNPKSRMGCLGFYFMVGESLCFISYIFLDGESYGRAVL